MAKLTADDAFELGNLFRATAVALGDWRIANRNKLNQEEWDKLDDQEITLLNAASDMYTAGIELVLDDAKTSLSQLRSSVKKAKAAVRHIETVKQAMGLVTALLLLAVAVSSGNLGTIPPAIKGVKEAAEAIPKPGGTDE